MTHESDQTTKFLATSSDYNIKVIKVWQSIHVSKQSDQMLMAGVFGLVEPIHVNT